MPVCAPYNIWACSRRDDRQSPPGPGLGHQSALHTLLGILEGTRMKLTVPAYGLLLGHWHPTDVWVPVPSRWSLRPSTGIPPITDHHPGGRSREQQSLCSVPTPLMSHLMKRGGCWGSCSMVQHQAVNSGPTWGCVFLMPPCFWQSGQNLAHRRAAGGHFVERWQSSFCSCLYKGSV